MFSVASLTRAAKSAIRSTAPDRKSTRLNSSHHGISYGVFCLKKKRPTDRVGPGGGGEDRHCRGAAQERSIVTPSLAVAPRRRFLFFNDTATTEISPLSRHGALPI